MYTSNCNYFMKLIARNMYSVKSILYKTKLNEVEQVVFPFT